MLKETTILNLYKVYYITAAKIFSSSNTHHVLDFIKIKYTLCSCLCILLFNWCEFAEIYRYSLNI